MALLPITTGSSYPDVSTQANGELLPFLFSMRTTVKHYGETVCYEIANSDWTGEVLNFGAKVIIRRVPTVTVRNYTKDLDLNTAGLYTTPTASASELELNKGKVFAVSIDDVDRLQSDMAYLDLVAEDASHQIVIQQDTDFLSGIAADIAATNQGATAGPGADTNLGATGAPVTITTANALQFLMRINRVLTQMKVKRANRWAVIPTKYAQILKNTDLKSALVTGDEEGVIRNGRLGSIDGLTLYESVFLPTFTEGASVAEPVYVGHPDGVTFASQIINVEQIRLQNKFASAIRGLAVYGYKVVEPTYLAKGYVIFDSASL